MSKGRKVINRKTITVSLSLAAGTSSIFSIPIAVEFGADTMVVKQITYGGSSVAPANRIPGAMSIYTGLVNDNIGSFYDSCTVTPNLTYNLVSFNRNTTTTFQVRNSAGTIDNTFAGNLFVHLEFLEHQP